MTHQAARPILPFILIGLAILAFVLPLTGCAEPKPVTLPSKLETMTVAQYAPGTENYTVWELTQ